LRIKGSNCKLDLLCGLFGKSRQAYYQRIKYNYRNVSKTEILFQIVQKERKLMPRLGGRKLLLKVQHRLPQELHLGRDAFFDFLRDHGLLVRKRRNRTITTNSHHWLRKYPNLIKDFTPTQAHQLWVSDITYIETREGFVYLSLITDAYSRKIIGWALGDSLEAKHSVDALHMALKQLPKTCCNVYHHSDRGIQYCCEDYVKILKKKHFQISMTENGDPLENPIAERVNGILKDEWLNQAKLQSREQAIRELKQIIQTYNTKRPHSSVNMFTPELAHSQVGTIERRWKNYYKGKKQGEVLQKNVVLECPTERWRDVEPSLEGKNGWGIEPHTVFAQQNSGSTLPIVKNNE
jgi:putative transposase